MAQLPFLVVHGDVVGQLLVVAGGALGVAAAWLVRWLRERRRLAVERRTLGREVGSLSSGRAGISGTLRGRAATAISESGKVLRARSDELALEVGGVLVELRGDVEVHSGTRTASSSRRLPRGFVGEGADDGGDGARGAWRAYELRDGDIVIARGMLATEAGTPREVSGDDDSDPTELATVRDAYRDPAGVWVMTPMTEVPVVQLWAARPRVRPEPYHLKRLALLWAVWVAVTHGALWIAGNALLRQHRLDLAAATPHARDAALAELDHDYEVAARTDRTFELRDELAELRGPCSARAQLELREQRYEQALLTSRRCGLAASQIDALVYLGRYREADQIGRPRMWPASGRDVLIAIANDRWDVAARIADDTARYGGARYRCLAAWFRAKSKGVRARADGAVGNDITCLVAHAMLLPPSERGAELHDDLLLAQPAAGSAIQLARDLAWVYGGAEPRSPADVWPDAIWILTGGIPRGARVWLAPVAIDHGSSDAVDRVERYSELAALDIIRGNMPIALSRVLSARQTLGEHTSIELEGLRQAIVLHAPDPIASDPDSSPHPSVAPLVELRAGRMPERLAVATLDRAGDLPSAIRASLAGDAAPLARELAARRPMWEADASAVLAVAPRMQQHRDQLADALRNFHSEIASDMDRMPFGFLEEAMMHRDLAALASDSDSAARWQKLIDAQLPLLDDPDKVIALLLWQAN